MTDTRRDPAPGPGDVPVSDSGPWQAPGSDAGPGAGPEWSSPDADVAQSTDAGVGSVPVSPSFSSHATSGPRLTYDPGVYGRGADKADAPAPAFNRRLEVDSDPDPGDQNGADSRSGEDGGRHPFDPDEARSTKAAAVLALGVAALITGPLVGGLVPAALAFILAREARIDLIAGRGYLTGGRQIRLGTNLAWVGIALAAAALVAAAALGILSLAHGRLHDFPNTSD